ncbi:MAG: methyl-accepting chemotaxis protein [Thermoanaerobacteraceae bacterium]|uniref:Methyl-accepting chemotaxis protein n=2 Tax=Biomaibacter acetigenes TaxID=2316383 RepID=A0A3G2R8E9_9FIRM|nr:methyl-accepting chemotaxis protein [Biomaibacter acetigenes]MDK2879754.1 methyl-accepting chemotaxis protein [Thermoanaerobacteraceae bacterium]RKL62246.1 methyl-accepting chemotaxis protein [Thermoanaerobacteraceae bacterium SP2]
MEEIFPRIGDISNNMSHINGKKHIIIKSIETAASMAEEVSASSEQIAASLQELNASSQEVASSAQTLSNMSKNLVDDVSQLKFKISNFP